MKKAMMLLLLSGPIGSVVAQNLTVGKGDQNPHDYATLTQAFEAANDGDTIHLYPGDYSSEPNLTIDKSVALIGPGYRVAENFPSQNTILSIGAVLPEVMVDCNGCTVALSKVYSFKPIYAYGATHLVATNSYIKSLWAQNVENVIVNSCYFPTNHSFNGYSAAVLLSKVREARIISNIFFSTSSTVQYHTNSRSLDWAPDNNPVPPQSVLYRNNFINGSIYLSHSVSSYNNIFRSGALARSNTLANSHHNVGVGSCSGADCSTGYVGVPNLDSVFVDYSSGLQSASFDARFDLRPTSPAIAAGLGGVDCGPFGGDSPYALSGIAQAPFIEQLEVQLQTSSPAPVRVVAKSPSQ